ncbi:MAG: hypothetical protein JSV44_03070 [Candidatus Zixiibacteriota bacterium]|nr:MAG: hypothetical protein JSV44_03070 [candidate division Zixibacteria bacterium]
MKEGILRREYFFRGEYVDGIDYGMLSEEYRTLNREKMRNEPKIPAA